MLIPVQPFRSGVELGVGYGYGLDAVKRQVPSGVSDTNIQTLPVTDPTLPFYPGAATPTNTGVLFPTDPQSLTSVVNPFPDSSDSLTSLPTVSPDSTVLAQNLASASEYTSAPAVITATVFAFPPSQSSASTSLSAGAGAGIAIVICVILAALAITSFVFWTRRRSRHNNLRLFNPTQSRGQVDRVLNRFSASPGPQLASEVSLPPEALRTSPYTLRKPPPRYTIIEKTSSFSPTTSPGSEKTPISYPDVVYIKGTRISSPPDSYPLPIPHSDVDVISISNQDEKLDSELEVRVDGLQLPDLVLKHPGYISPFSGSVRVERLLRTFTQRTTGTGQGTTPSLPGPDSFQVSGVQGAYEFLNAGRTTTTSETEVEDGTPPQCPSSSHGGQASNR